MSRRDRDDDERWGRGRRDEYDDDRDRRRSPSIDYRDRRRSPSIDYGRHPESSRDRRSGRDRRRSRSRSGSRSRSPRRRSHSPPRTTQKVGSPTNWSPGTRTRARSEAVSKLVYIVYDHHKDHKYANEEDRKDSGLLARDKMSNFFAAGPVGDATRAFLKKRLAFGKHEDVHFKMNLSGSTEKAISVIDHESFGQFELLLGRLSSVQIAQAGMVEVKMLLDQRAKNLMEKGGQSANANRTDVRLLNALNEQLGKKKGMRGVSGSWDALCDTRMADAGDKFSRLTWRSAPMRSRSTAMHPICSTQCKWSAPSKSARRCMP